VGNEASARQKPLGVPEVAKELNYSEKSVREMLNRGDIKGTRIRLGGKWLVTRENLDSYKEEHGLIQRTIPEQAESNLQQDTPTPKQISHVENHDIEIFKKSNSIMSEENLLDFLWPLDGGPSIYYYRKAEAVERFLQFFSFVGNQYLDREALRLCNNLCEALRKLEAFLCDNFRPPQRSGVSDYARLIPGECAHGYYSGEEDSEDEKIYWKYFDELQELNNTCKDCMKQYRAYIRDTLFQ